MTMVVEQKLRDFNFWSGAEKHAEKLTYEELDELDDIMDDLGQMADKPMTETEVNDLMWFSFPAICEWLGLDYYKVMERE